MDPYRSVYDADTYFTTRFNSPLWSPLSETQKQSLLVTATRLIDTLNFAGEKNDENQETEFPRGEDTVIPTPIADACCEIAYALANGYDPEHELRNISQTQLSFDTSRLQSDTRSYHEARVHGIPSVVAWDLLRPFLRDGSSITLSRVD